MESTRIPKPSGYKPRTKLPVVHAKDARTGPSAAPMFLRGLDKLKAKPLSTINENKGAPNVRSVSPDMQNSRADVQSFRALALRRRSKSVTDLRTFPAKPLKVENFRGAAAKPSIQKTAKRALENKNDNDSGASKPKVPRTRKIPDWDYKSRFLESQKKHTLVVDELKKLKEMTSSKFFNVVPIEKQLVYYFNCPFFFAFGSFFVYKLYTERSFNFPDEVKAIGGQLF